MKKGDYSVHILVEEVKSLPQLNENHLRYPVVKLTVFNQSKRTEKTKLHYDNYTYDEHMKMIIKILEMLIKKKIKKYKYLLN